MTKDLEKKKRHENERKKDSLLHNQISQSITKRVALPVKLEGRSGFYTSRELATKIYRQ